MDVSYETDRAIADFICKFCGERTKSQLVLNYVTTALFRGQWILKTEVETSSGKASCMHCNAVNEDIWPKYSATNSWSKR